MLSGTLIATPDQPRRLVGVARTEVRGVRATRRDPDHDRIL
jgi:hypothetical protein